MKALGQFVGRCMMGPQQRDPDAPSVLEQNAEKLGTRIRNRTNGTTENKLHSIKHFSAFRKMRTNFFNLLRLHQLLSSPHFLIFAFWEIRVCALEPVLGLGQTSSAAVLQPWTDL
jgi:hypothetical protein